MRLHALYQVANQSGLASLAFLLAQGHRSAESVRDEPHATLLPVLPDPVGHVEQDSLEEQHERHPLVVAMVRPLLVVLVSKSGLGHGRANLATMLAGQRESIRDPAVRVDHVAGNSAVVDARNRITCYQKKKKA